jgi:hypothetical protein
MAIDLHYGDRHVTRSRPLTMPMIGVRQIPSLFRMSAIAGESIGLPAWSLAEQISLKRRAEPEPHSASDQCSCGLAMAEHESAYNEEAFHYLLAVERKRFEHSSRPFVLLLVDLRGRSGQPARMDPAQGALVFAGLARSLRDTDVIGWYREGRIAGAVLTHLGDASITDVSRQMAGRVTQTLRNDLPEAIACRLKVRLYQPLASVQP